MRNYCGWFFFFSITWWIVLLPYHFDVLSVILDPVHTLLYHVIISVTGSVPFHSDSSGMYLLLLICPLLGSVIATCMLLPVTSKWKNNGFRLGKVLLRYFLVLELWKYGWIKLIKLQFYLPEPNIVYTRLGELSKDMAYWSVMGSSHSYVVFLGITELIAGTLLLFRRTRFIALLLAFGIFVNVVMVNMAFDISVKLFALTSLSMVIMLFTDHTNQLRYLFQLPVTPVIERLYTRSRGEILLKAFIVALFVMETVYPSVIMESMNDDRVERMEHHGAYAVKNNQDLKSLYVHRQGYVIFENHQNALHDLKVTINTNENWSLSNEYSGEKSTLTWMSSHSVIWKQQERTDTLSLRRLPYRNLPVLQTSFHWISDSFH